MVLPFGTSIPKQHRSNRFVHTLHTTTSQDGTMFTAVPTSLSDTDNHQTSFNRSECAATRVNLLKDREKCHRQNTSICRRFAISRYCQQTITLPSHGRGRWFEPSIAHQEIPANDRKREASGFRAGGFLLQPYCNAMDLRWCVESRAATATRMSESGNIFTSRRRFQSTKNAGSIKALSGRNELEPELPVHCVDFISREVIQGFRNGGGKRSHNRVAILL